MKKLTTLLLLLTLLLSVLASCQGTEPTGSLPQTKETAPLTEGKKTEPKQTTEQEETVPQTKTEEQAVSTEEPEMTLDQAKRILEKQLDAPQKKSDGSYEYLVREEVSKAILCVKENVYYYETGNIPSVTIGKEEAAKMLREYLGSLDQVIAEKNCAIVFENTVAFREDKGAYYLPDSSENCDNLYYFRDRGTTKEFVYSVEDTETSSVVIYPYAFSDNLVLETVTITAPRNERRNSKTEKLVYPLEVSFGIAAFANCPSLTTVNIPGNEIIKDEPARQYDPEDEGRRRSLVPLFSEDFGYADGATDVEEEWVSQTFNEFQGYYEKSVLTNNIVDENPANFVVKDGVLVAYVGIGGHVMIPEGVTEIRGNVFNHCKNNVLSVTFPSTLKKICTWAFHNVRLPLVYHFPADLEVIEEDAFGLGISQPYFLVTGIPEDCRVAEGAFPLDWMESYGRTHQELPKELKNAQKPNA